MSAFFGLTPTGVSARDSCLMTEEGGKGVEVVTTGEDVNLEGIVIIYASLALTTLGFLAKNCEALRGHGELGLQQVGIGFSAPFLTPGSVVPPGGIRHALRFRCVCINLVV